jgi:probable rRNA maturation factor
MAASVAVEVGDGVTLAVPGREIEDAVLYTLAAEGVNEGEISVAIVGDEEITRLNAQYLAHDGPTDVISFSLSAPGGPLVGDIYVGGEQARRQADDLGEAQDVELLRLAIHGTLHVLGHEHPEGEARAESPMYLRQEELLAGFLSGRSG